MDLVHIGVALAFAVLHLLLYGFFRREPGNLYFALFALGFAGMTWGTHGLDLVPDAPPDDTTLRLTYTFGILQAFALQRFAHLVFLDRSPPIFYAILAWGVGVVAWTWSVSPEALRIAPVMYLALATTLELLRTVTLAARGARRPGAWLIYLGFGVLALAGALQSLASLDFVEVSGLPTYPSGVMFFLFSVSVYLSRRFATTALELERQLAEVQRLSERTLELAYRARGLGQF